jgi:hypothetical protein
VGRAGVGTVTTQPNAPSADPATIAWLLDGDPAIRWQTQRDLLDEPPAVFEGERARVSIVGWGRDLLDRQDLDGRWGGGLYSPKWTSTTYTLLLLWRLGLTPGNAQALRGVRLLWDGARYFGSGLTCAVTIDAPEVCVTAMYITLAVHFGFDDQRVDSAVDWLVSNQMCDGGWNCEALRSGAEHGSFHTSIMVLEALEVVSRLHDHPGDIEPVMQRGQEFFLAHRLFRSHHTGEVVNPVFGRLSFPPRWHYDILRGLDHFAATSAPWDERARDAYDLVVGRRRKDGRWPVQQKHSGRVWFDMERTGGPSRWNTLRALRVLEWAERASA